MTKVTPCVGVWIETPEAGTWSYPDQVTPCVGVWIETSFGVDTINYVGSHPAWVCGLKPEDVILVNESEVTPCVGVWIETHQACALF